MLLMDVEHFHTDVSLIDGVPVDSIAGCSLIDLQRVGVVGYCSRVSHVEHTSAHRNVTVPAMNNDSDVPSIDVLAELDCMLVPIASYIRPEESTSIHIFPAAVVVLELPLISPLAETVKSGLDGHSTDVPVSSSVNLHPLAN